MRKLSLFLITAILLVTMLAAACTTAAPASPSTAAAVSTQSPSAETSVTQAPAVTGSAGSSTADSTAAASTASTASTAADATQPLAQATSGAALPVTGETQAAQGSTPAAGAVTYKIDPSQSKVSYQVDETFLQGNRLNTAVGVTSGITGTLQIDPNNPQNSKLGTFTVDISQFTSDSNRRDQTIRNQFLQSATYPIATFVPTSIDGLPASIQDGKDYSFKVNGNLTIRQVTKPVIFDVTTRLAGNTLSGQATTQILMSDFGFGPISLFGMLQTKDQVNVTFQFVATPQS